MHICLEPGCMHLHLRAEILGFHLGVTQTKIKSIFSFMRHLLLRYLYSKAPNIVTDLLRCQWFSLMVWGFGLFVFWTVYD